MGRHSSKYTDYVNPNNPEWQRRRLAKFEQTHHRCEYHGCTRRAVDVHHPHYDTLGEESLNDLQALCREHHRMAEYAKAVERDRRAVVTYCDKVLGHYWQDDITEAEAEETWLDFIAHKGGKSAIQEWEEEDAKRGRLYAFPTLFDDVPS